IICARLVDKQNIGAVSCHIGENAWTRRMARQAGKRGAAARNDANGHRRGSGVAHVYETLRNEIVELTLAPGSPIDELQLAERFSLSRTPIREALVRLAAE